MAFTTTVAEKRQNVGSPGNRNSSVYTRNITFSIPSGQTTSGCTVGTIPGGTAIIQLYHKQFSATGLTGSTMSYALSGTTFTTTGAISTSQLVLQAVTAANAYVAVDTPLICNLSTGAVTTDTAVAEVTIVCANIDTASSVYTTYTN